MDFAPGGRTGVLDYFGYHEDVYARTPQGWRFKSRRFVNQSQAALKVAATEQDEPPAHNPAHWAAWTTSEELYSAGALWGTL